MESAYQFFKFFISSPNDVGEERKISNQVINDVNKRCRDTLGVVINDVAWEDRGAGTPDYEESVQDEINEEIKKCHGFILILNKRYGTRASGQEKSNTEREVDLVLKMMEEGKRIMFLPYFKVDNETPLLDEQRVAVENLKEKLRNINLISVTYKTSEEFRNLLTHDLYSTLLRFRMSTTKVKALKVFWKLGAIDEGRSPQLAIIWSTVQRKYMREENPDKFWLRRLVPNVIFEDAKALEKVEKTLRLIGFRDYQSFSNTSIPHDIHNFNRVWICFPRNRPSEIQSNRYKNVSRFQFVGDGVNAIDIGQEFYLKWKDVNDPTNIRIVKSPLFKYLEEQRGLHPGGEWREELGNVIAKDFAVLARFSDERQTSTTETGSLKDYFITGLHGLGTWGAAWFLDRQYKFFKQMEGNVQIEDEPIQILLEVTYRNKEIYEVIPVSDMDQNYFEMQNDISIIRENITKLNFSITENSLL